MQLSAKLASPQRIRAHAKAALSYSKSGGGGSAAPLPYNEPTSPLAVWAGAVGLVAVVRQATSSTQIVVPLRSDRYEDVTIRYANENDDVPTFFSVEVRHGKKPDLAARDLLARRLNGGLADGNWHWGDVRISWSALGLLVDVGRRSPLEIRRRRAAAAWSLIDHAKNDVATLFPGALIESKIQMNATIPLDHPFLRSATIDWFTMVGGTMRDVRFEGKSALDPQLDSFARCLGATLGAPRVSIVNPVEGTKSYTFYVGNAQIDVRGGMSMSAAGPHGLPETVDGASWNKIVSAIDGCRS